MRRWANADLERLLWSGRQILGRLGWYAVLGIACFTVSLLIAGLWLRPLWVESRVIQKQSEAFRIAAAQQQKIARQADPAAQLVEFYKLFPGSDSLSDTLDKVYAAAAENNIALNQGDYSLSTADGGVLQRYEIDLPVRGTYAQVRNFIAKVLAENKNAALTAITFSRNNSTDIGVEAQVRFDVYVKDAS